MNNKMGRPIINIDKAQFENLCAMQCTEIEIASFFDCCDDTINNWCKKEYGMTFSDIYKIKSAKGKISLRRMQFKLAKTNASLSIWLGKQYLGQTDKIELGSVDEDKSIKIEMVSPSEADAERVKKIREKLFKSEN